MGDLTFNETKVSLDSEVEIKISSGWESYSHFIAWCTINGVPFKSEGGQIITKLKLRDLYSVYQYMTDLMNKGVLTDTYLCM